jgi:hypothetical protein
MKSFKDYKMSDYVDGKHDFVTTTLFKGHSWSVCVWCQQFEDDVKDRPCKGPMKINLN